VVPPLALFLAGFIAFLLAQQRLAVILILGFMAYLLMTILVVMVRGLFSRGKRAQGKLGVVDSTLTGNAVLDAILGQMLATGKSRTAYRWLYGSRALNAAGLYAIIERRLAEHGWITLTGKQPVLGLLEVETLVLNRQTDQWQAICSAARSCWETLRRRTWWHCCSA
jgi:hypothetical protein